MQTNIATRCIVVLGVLSIFFSACGSPTPLAPEAAPPPSQTAVRPAPTGTSTATSAPTLSPSPLPTATQTPTLTPTGTFTPSPTPAPTQTPLPWTEVELSPSNASQMTKLSEWGRGAVYQQMWAADGMIYLVFSGPGIYLYESITFELIRHIPHVKDFRLSPDTLHLVVLLENNQVVLYDPSTGNERANLGEIAEIPRYLLLDLELETQTEKEMWLRYYQYRYLRHTAWGFSEDSTLAAIAFADSSIGLVDLVNATLITNMRTHLVGASTALVFSPSGDRLLADTEIAVQEEKANSLALFSIPEGQLLWKQTGIGHFNGQPFSYDGTLLATEVTSMKSNSSVTTLRETRYGTALGEVNGGAASHPFSPDNKMIVTSYRGTVRVWDAKYLFQMKKIETGLEAGLAWNDELMNFSVRASFTADGRHILINEGEQAYLVDGYQPDSSYPPPLPPPEPIQVDLLRRAGHIPPAEGVIYLSPESILVWGRDGSQTIWWWDPFHQDYHSARLDFSLASGANLAMSPQGSYLTACTSGGLMVFNIETQQQQYFSRCRPRAQVGVSGDGKAIFRNADTVIDGIDPQTGEVLFTLRGYEKKIAELRVSSEGNYLATASEYLGEVGRELVFWRVKPAARLGTFMVPVHIWNSLDDILVTANEESLMVLAEGLRVWRIADLWQTHLDGGIMGTTLAVSPDGELVAIAGYDTKIHVWSSPKWESLTVLEGHSDRITRMLFSPDGANLVSVSMDGILRLWGIPE